MSETVRSKLLEEIGRYGANAAATGVLAPDQALLDAVDAATPTARPERGEVTDAQCADHLDKLAALRWDALGSDAWGEAFRRGAQALRAAPPAPEVTEAMVAPLIEALHGMGYPAIRHADARRALTAALRGGAR